LAESQTVHCVAFGTHCVQPVKLQKIHPPAPSCWYPFAVSHVRQFVKLLQVMQFDIVQN